MIVKGLLAAGIAVGVATAAAGMPPVEAYGQLPSVDLIALSPDGTRMALAVTGHGAREVQVRTVADRQLVTGLPTGTVKVRALQWVGDHHLIVTKSTTADIAGTTGPRHEYALAVDINLATGKAQPLLSGVGDNTTETLNTIAALPEARTIKGRPVAFLVGTAFANMRGIHALFRADLDSRTTRMVAQGNVDTEDWLLDADGEIAARVDYVERSGRWSLWTRRGDPFVKSMEDTRPLDPPELKGFGRSATTVMVATRDDDDWSYREIALGGDTPSPPVTALAGAGLIVDPTTHLVIGGHRDAGLAVDYTFLAEPDQRLWRAVRHAFPDAVVRIESWSDDRRTLVLRVEGKAAGAAYFLLDTVHHKADWLANEYQGIDAADLGEVRQIVYKATDGLAIPAFLTLPPGTAKAAGLPLVVLPHGGPGVHDAPGFDWWAQAIAARGYAVLQPEYRGSTGFGEAFHTAGFGEWGRRMQTDLSDGVAHLAADGTIDSNRVCIVGGSYGGYAALAGVALQHGIYRCAVSLAGPSDLRAMLAEVNAAHHGERSETMRFWQRFMGAKSPSDHALDAISPVRFAARVDVPVLLIHGVDDTVVAFSQSKAMAAALARAGHPAQFVTLAGEDHWLSRGETRTAMLKATLDFLAVNLPVAATAAPRTAGR